MKKIALLGDSIRLIGYGKIVAEMLEREVEVFQSEDNGRFAKYMLRSIFDMHEQLKDCEVIHFNCGHWDVCDIMGDGQLFSTDEEYIANLERIAKALLKITPKVIFATITPVNPQYKYNRNEDIDRFNEKAVKKMKELGVQINDLNSLVKENVEEYLCEDMLHLSPTGTQLCARQVVEYIKSNL
ncbi:MAG: hypothetical protein IKD03_03620 [Clostridia bacterium]|nr:hypothetical protein [Clostridia bacterium]